MSRKWHKNRPATKPLWPPGSRSLGWAWLAITSIGLAGCSGPNEPPSEARPRLVLFVVLDTLAAQHVSHLGYDRETTPHLDALARDGLTFEQVITPATYTVASVPSILTGRLPDRHGLTWYDRRLPEKETTLAELFDAAGYATYAAVGVLNGGPAYGTLQGFDEAIEVYVGEGPPGAESMTHDGRTVHLPRANEFVPLAADRIARMRPDEELFLYLHILEPHDPYDPPPEFKELLTDERFPGPYIEGRRDELRSLVPHDRPPSREVIEEVVHMYDTNIRWADHNLGQILEVLRARGLYDEALIVVTADHGEAFWQHGVRGHGERLHEEEAHVPLVVKLPSSRAHTPSRIPALVSTLDILPTLCEWLDLDPPEAQLDGVSLAGLARDPRAPSPRDSVFLRSRKDARQFGLRLADKKAILHLPRKGDPEARLELFDLRTDPGERLDISAARPREATLLRQAIRRTLQTLERDGAAREQRIPAADVALLEALGYAGVVEDE